MSIREWATFFEAYATAYVKPEATYERDRLERCVAALRGMGDLDVEAKLLHALACELAQSRLEGLESGRAAARVSSSRRSCRCDRSCSAPVFLVGMRRSRLLPAPDRPSPLDLRAAERRAGDVRPREGERYLFLETLFCARDRIVVSYVGRDETTNEPIETVERGRRAVRHPRRDVYFEGAWAARCHQPRTSTRCVASTIATKTSADAERAIAPPAQEGAAVERRARALRASYVEIRSSRRSDDRRARRRRRAAHRFARAVRGAPRAASGSRRERRRRGGERGASHRRASPVRGVSAARLRAPSHRARRRQGRGRGRRLATNRSPFSAMDRAMLGQEGLLALLRDGKGSKPFLDDAPARLEAHGRGPTGVASRRAGREHGRRSRSPRRRSSRRALAWSEHGRDEARRAAARTRGRR